MLRLSISGFEKLANSLARRINSAIEKETEIRVKYLVQNLAFATPKDTGYAASRWTYKESPVTTIKYNIRTSNGFLLFNTKEYSISNDAPYIVYLNRGWSKQAPSYFIESTILNSGFKINSVIVTQEEKNE